jgi:integrase
MARRTWGAVRQLPSGRWQARYPDPSGASKAAPQTFPSKADASRWLAKMQTEIDRGGYHDPKAGAIKLADYGQDWIANRRVKGQPLAPRTKDLYEWQLKKHFALIAGVELRHLDQLSVRRWHAGLTKGDKGQVNAAKCYRLLRAMLNTAVSDGLIVKNPCTIRGAGQEYSPERPMITVEQLQRAVDATPERWRAALLLAGWCALRFGELAGLRREDLDLKAGVVHVRTSVTHRKGGGRNVRRTKTDSSMRSIAIPPHILGDLQLHLDSFAAAGSQGWVFVGPRGGQIASSNFRVKVWDPARAAAGIPDVHLHDLRGFSATMVARHGATTKDLMHRLGHATPDMALRYQRAEAERDAQLARAMSAALMPRRATDVPQATARSGQERATDDKSRSAS